MKRLHAIVPLLLLATPAAAAPPPPPLRIEIVTTSQAPKSESWRPFGSAGGSWCADKGAGAGEGLEIRFDEPQPLTLMEFTSGERIGAVGKLTDPTKIELFVGKKRLEVDVKPGDITKIVLDGTPVDAVQFEVLEVAPGKTKKTCVSSIRFLAGTDRYLNMLAGLDQAAYEDLPRAITALDAAFQACDATALATAVKYPLKHTHMRSAADMGWDVAKKATYKTAKDLVKACSKKGSYIARSRASVSEEPIADAWTYAEQRAAAVVDIPGGEVSGWTFTRKGDVWLLTDLTTETPEDE